MKIKETINRYPKLSVKKLINIVKGYDIVSFDIFDTLIKRDVYKEHDVFDLIEKRYNATYKDSIDNFRYLRVEAERIARKNSNTEEVSLKEIYISIALLDKTYETRLEVLRLLEEEIEYEISYPNQLIKEVYDYCLLYKKKIYIISDMYLSKKLIEKILKKNGYALYKNLFLSSEIGLQKKTGNLFKHVLKVEGVKADSIIHIGDN